MAGSGNPFYDADNSSEGETKPEVVYTTIEYGKNIKMGIRYVVIAFIMYLAYKVTSIGYITALGPDSAGVLQVATGAVFGSLSMVLGFHFNSKVEK